MILRYCCKFFLSITMSHHVGHSLLLLWNLNNFLMPKFSLKIKIKTKKIASLDKGQKKEMKI